MRTFPVVLYLAVSTLTSLFCAAATADPRDLSGGVLIAHYVPELLYTYDPPPGGWCAAYLPFTIHNLPEVIDSIRVGGTRPAVWYLIAAWENEDKTWRQVDLGFGGFDPAAFAFASAGPCFPGTGFEIPTTGWPGPNEGTSFATIDQPWIGNWLPIYAFGGYAYGDSFLAARIELGPNPATGEIGFLNCEPTPVFFPVNEGQRGAMGINMSGVVPAFPAPPEFGTCCIGGVPLCVYEQECLILGGVFLPGVP
jgi:hypothetical protein